MSVELIVYPQNYQGLYTYSSSISSAELVADPFWQYASSGIQNYGTTSSSPANAAMVAAPPYGAWRGFRTTGGTYASVNAPAFAWGGGSYFLQLSSSSPSSINGVYTLITGLTIGFVYDIKITIRAGGGGTGTLVIGNPTQQSWVVGSTTYYSSPYGSVATQTNPASSTTYNFTFTAISTNHVLCLSWEGSGDRLDILSTSVKQSPLTQSIVDISDGQEILDMYSQTSIPLSLSIDDFKKMAEKPQSYSKAFNLPATKHNNKIFTNIFDVTVSVDKQSNVFNPYNISKALLKEDGHTIFEGHLQLIDIKDKDGEISYNVNLFSQAVSLKSLLGNKTFNDFDNGFDELQHEYHKGNIKDSWIGKLPITVLPSGYEGFAGDAGDTTTDVLKYPYCRWNGGITQQSGGGVSHFPKLNLLQNAFRPWIRVKYLFDRILHEAGFSYESDFINGTGNYDGTSTPAITAKNPDFKRLFMDFNWGDSHVVGNFGWEQTIYYTRDEDSSLNSATSSWQALRFTDDEDTLSAHGWDVSNDKFVVPHDDMEYTIDFSVECYSYGGGAVFDVRIVHIDDSASTTNVLYTKHWTPSGAQNMTTSQTVIAQCDEDDEIQLQFKKTSGSVKQGNNSSTSTQTASLVVTIAAENITSDSLLVKRGKIKQWDFIKDIFTMFNLMVLVDKDDQSKLKIEPYGDIFIDNVGTTNITEKTHDWTDKVDASQMEMKPIKIKKQVSFKYKKEAKDYAKGVYNEATGYDFGDFDISTGATVPTGEEKIALKVFASTFCTPIFSNFTQQLTIPQIISQKSDGTIEGFDNTPRILYDETGNQSAVTNLPQLPNGSVLWPAFNGLYGENQTHICRFLHTTKFPTNNSARDINFGTHQLVSSMTGAGGTNTGRNLFNEYWSPYYDELYHSDTKSVKIKVLLTPLEIGNINYYDKVFIKNRLYRINKLDYKVGELSTAELILLP